MRKVKVILFLTICLLNTVTRAQTNTTEEKKHKGKVIISIFGDFHSGFGPKNDDRNFFLDRAYLGYQYQIGNELELKVILDAGKSSDVKDYQRIIFLKNALVTWKHRKLTLKAGLIPTSQFSLQDKVWRKRYILKSFQDKYKFGSSADLGVNAEYRFTRWFSADATIVNGEGYKKIDISKGLLYGLGLTFNPVRKWTIRTYASFNEGNNSKQSDIYNVSFFTAYQAEKWSAGGEYNHIFHAKNVAGNHKYGFSAFANVQLKKKIAVFGKIDYVTSKDKWDIQEDGLLALIGTEFSLGKYIKLAPNLRLWNPAGQTSDIETYAYLNFSFAL